MTTYRTLIFSWTPPDATKRTEQSAIRAQVEAAEKYHELENLRVACDVGLQALRKANGQLADADRALVKLLDSYKALRVLTWVLFVVAVWGWAR